MQKNIDIITKTGDSGTISYEKNDLNGNWMVWFNLHPTMLAFKTKNELNGFLKDIRKNCKILKEY
jgi:hypothetical protein